MSRDVVALDDSPREPAIAPSAQQAAEPRALPTTPAALAPLWSKVIRAEGVPALLRAVLINSTLESLEHGRATIVCAARYASAAQTKWRGSIVELLSRESGGPVELTIQSTDGGVAPTTAPAAAESTDQSSDSPTAGTPSHTSAAPSRPGAPNSAAEHPLVKQALELFGGRIVDIQPRRR